MKIAFYILLLANVVFYLWETGGSRPPSNVDMVELQLPENVEQIRLLKELPVLPKKVTIPAAATLQPADPTPSESNELPPGVSLVKPSASPVSAAPEADPFCFLFGPYDQAAKAQVVADAQQSKLKDVSVVEKTDVAAEGYWVLYPKAENIYAARANRKMLMDKGVQDAWIFDKGDMAGAISLGVFKTRDKADLMQEQLRSKGIEVEVKPRLARSDAYWVQFSWKNGREALSKLLPEEGELTLKSCNP